MDSRLEQPLTSSRHFTARAFLIGLALIILTNIWATYSEYYMQSSILGGGVVPMSIFMPLAILVMVVNVLLKAMAPRWALSASELIIVFIMCWAGNAAGWAAWFLALMSAPYYFATAENEWADYFHAYIPKWLVPANEGNAMGFFYEGLPSGESIPWAVWITPLCWWFTFIVAGLIASICLAAVFRRQWTERERLIFPLARVPVDMVTEANPRGLLPFIMANRLFWIGFSIPFIILCWNIVGFFHPTFPAFEFIYGKWLRLGRAFPHLYNRINFYVIGFGYLAPVDVLFSIWFFHILALVQIGIYNRLGVQVGPPSEWSNTWALVNLQGCGGYIFLGLWFLWVSRRHLRDVLAKAWDPSHPADDSQEFVSYRTAVVGFVVCLAYMLAFLYKAGMSMDIIAIYVVLAFLFTIVYAKVVAESGLVFFGWAFSPQQFAIFCTGSAVLSPMSMTATTVSWVRGLFGCCELTHMAKMADNVRTSKGKLAVAICVASIVGTIVSLWFAMHLAYRDGAYNTQHWTYIWGNRGSYQNLVGKLKTPVGPDWEKMSLVGIGGVFTGFLTFMRYRFTWWPLHPVGFTMATMWIIRISAVSIFIVWLFKSIFIRLGGLRLAKKAEPFFIGLLCGYTMAVAIGFVVDLIWFPMQGHRLYYP